MESKRIRSPNFTRAEVKVMLAGIADNQRIIFSPVGTTVFHLNKETVWKSILENVNAVGRYSRSLKEIKKKFHDMNSRTKCRTLQLRRESANGNIVSKPLTPIEKKILSLCATAELSNLSERKTYIEGVREPRLSTPQSTDTSENSTTSSPTVITYDHPKSLQSHSFPLSTFKLKKIPNPTKRHFPVVAAVDSRQDENQNEQLQGQQQPAERQKDHSSPSPVHRKVEQHKKESLGLMSTVEIFSRNQLQLVAAMNRQADELAAIRKLLEKFLTER